MQLLIVTGRKEKPDLDAELAKWIQECQDKTDKTYGYRRVWKWLKDRNMVGNPKTVLRVMKKVWFVVRDLPLSQVDKPWSADT